MLKRFIIYLASNSQSNNKNDDKQQATSKPIGLIQTPEIFGDVQKMFDSKSNQGFHIMIKKMDNERFENINSLIYEQNFNLIHFDSKDNCLKFSVNDKCCWFMRPPCKILIIATIRLHLELSSEIIHGLKEIFLINDAELCFVASSTTSKEAIIDLYTNNNPVKRIVTIQDRKQIASIFQNQENNFGQERFKKTNQNSYLSAEFIIYYNDKCRKKPVALIHGAIQLNQLPEENISFCPGEIVQIPDSELEIRVVIDDSTRKDRQYICQHWSLIKVDFTSDVFVYSLNPKCHFKLLKSGSIIIAGYVGLMKHSDHFNAKVISGNHSDIVNIFIDVNCRVFIGDHFMLLMAQDEHNDLQKLGVKIKSRC